MVGMRGASFLGFSDSLEAVIPFGNDRGWPAGQLQQASQFMGINTTFEVGLPFCAQANTPHILRLLRHIPTFLKNVGRSA
jgi:hypothetical protein